MKDNGPKMGLGMDEENAFGEREQFTKDTGSITNLKATADLYMTTETCTKGFGTRVKHMEKVYT